jgi:hypothetical protein
MKPEVVLELLESAAEQLKVRLSYEALQTSGIHGGHGGLCRVKGEYRIIVDKRASAEERVTTVATALAQMLRAPVAAGTVEATELTPKVRELVRMHDMSPARPGMPRAPAAGRTAA